MSTLFARPEGAATVLPRAPLRAIRDADGRPREDALTAYLAGIEGDLGWGPRAGAHLALRLDVGLPAGTPLTRGGHDLVDYLFPLVTRLRPVRFDAVFATKRAGGRSALRFEPARQVEATEPWTSVRTTEQATDVEWKRQVFEACRAAVAEPARPGPLAVDLRFTVSRRRNWAALWKPAVDALGPVLGVPDPERPYVADDARITALGLHRALDDTVGHGVLVELWWRPA